jgi:hypothetical protein
VRPREDQALSTKKRRDASSREEEDRPAKKPRAVAVKDVKPIDTEAGKKLGGLIGRKRKEKRSKGSG